MRANQVLAGMVAIGAGLVGCGGDDPTGPTVRAERLLNDRREIDLEFVSEDGTRLSGTVYLPLGPGPFRALAISGGSSWTVRSPWPEVAFAVTELNTAILAHDRRGAGQSGGSCCPADATTEVTLRATDAVAAVTALESLDRINPAAVGVMGSSLGGWVAPLAANLAPGVIDFVVISVGGAVSSGQEGLYDQLTGYDACTPTAMPMDEIIRQLEEAGPSGFDPRESLELMAQPAMWLFGGNDLSHPTGLAVRNLEEVQSRIPKDWTIEVFPTGNHDLIDGGSICQESGPLVDVITPMAAWLARFGN